MTIALYVIGGTFVYLLLGLVFIGTEVRWGFPFGHDCIGFNKKMRKSFAKDILGEKPIRNIIYAPIRALSYLVCLIIGAVILALILSVIAAWDFFSNGFSFKSTN